MGKTAKGRKVLRAFIKRYGPRGERVFYAWATRHHNPGVLTGKAGARAARGARSVKRRR